MAQEPTKIKIEVMKITAGGKETVIDSFEAQFNPPEYTVTKGVQIAEIGIPGLDSPILQFVRGTNEQITLSLFFDTTEDGSDVRKTTERFYKLVKIDSDYHAPPVCRLSWGKPMGGLVGESVGTAGVQENKFRGIVSSMTQKFTLFKSDGTPMRAELDVTFKEYKTIEQQVRELNLKSADHTKIRKVRKGETLSGIAAEEYDDPGKWREIAEANGIEDPKVLIPGQLLEIRPFKETT